MKPVLRLGFTDSFPTLDTFFIETLSKIFDIQRDDDNPQVLIFCDENFGNNNRKYDDRNVIKVFYTGENRRSQNYHCHFVLKQ